MVLWNPIEILQALGRLTFKKNTEVHSVHEMTNIKWKYKLVS